MWRRLSFGYSGYFYYLCNGIPEGTSCLLFLFERKQRYFLRKSGPTA